MSQSTDLLYDGKRFYDFGFGNQTSYYDVAAKALFVDDDDFVSTAKGGEASLPHDQAASHVSFMDMDTVPQRQERDQTGHTPRKRVTPNSILNGPLVAAAMRDTTAKKGGRGISEIAGATETLDPMMIYDEGAQVYDEVYSEDVFLGRATRVSAAFWHYIKTHGCRVDV